ncbi:MAG: hypothetical protein QOK91_09785 [Nitrososphaeraceae archaeon]|nr:hypothetical protein [Nitrososphaeraceae archaeon]MDW0183342.1 hypothetical protein [Nitrososphaeraceae archaeon]MDW0296492.1 hypothetical protein [Nitrososphaeraceae archaeon]MDW0335333.1 hypothetical protein [Nitrososphaeraceae archaeon]
MDASKRLLTLCTRENGKITRYPERLRILENGVEHYFVEVTCEDGLQYGWQAYGEEAIALYKESMKTVGQCFDEKVNGKLSNFLLLHVFIAFLY